MKFYVQNAKICSISGLGMVPLESNLRTDIGRVINGPIGEQPDPGTGR